MEGILISRPNGSRCFGSRRYGPNSTEHESGIAVKLKAGLALFYLCSAPADMVIRY